MSRLEFYAVVLLVGVFVAGFNCGARIPESTETEEQRHQGQPYGWAADGGALLRVRQ